MVETARNWVGDDFAREFAAVNEQLLTNDILKFTAEHKADAAGALVLSDEAVSTFKRSLLDFKVRVPDTEIRASIASLGPDSAAAKSLAHTWPKNTGRSTLST